MKIFLIHGEDIETTRFSILFFVKYALGKRVRIPMAVCLNEFESLWKIKRQRTINFSFKPIKYFTFQTSQFSFHSMQDQFSFHSSVSQFSFRSNYFRSFQVPLLLLVKQNKLSLQGKGIFLTLSFLSKSF